jgi:hypothetical protein
LADSTLFNFQASGPANLAAGQNASVCATNLDSSPVSVVIAVFQADTGALSSQANNKISRRAAERA